MFDVGTKLSAREIGSPSVDDAGEVVGILARACMPIEKGPCLPTSFGVPTDAMKAFIRTAPRSAVQPAAWLGMQGVGDKLAGFPGVRIVGVSPESPADEAGLRAMKDKTLSDLIVAVDDTPVASPDALSKMVATHGVGDRVKLLVLREGKLRDVVAVLKPVPSRDEKLELVPEVEPSPGPRMDNKAPSWGYPAPGKTGAKDEVAEAALATRSA